MDLRAHLTPVGLLVLPILAANVALASALPAAFQPEIFKAAIPPELTVAENGLRSAVFALAFFFPFRHTRVGWAIFLAGTMLYAAAWALQIGAPDSPLATSALGFTAPAWTAGVWLAGIGLLARPPAFAPHPGWIVAWWFLAAGFLAAHGAHAILIWTRL